MGFLFISKKILFYSILFYTWSSYFFKGTVSRDFDYIFFRWIFTCVLCKLAVVIDTVGPTPQNPTSYLNVFAGWFVNDTAELDYVVSMTPLSLTPWYQWHHWAWLHGINDTPVSETSLWKLKNLCKILQTRLVHQRSWDYSFNSNILECTGMLQFTSG